MRHSACRTLPDWCACWRSGTEPFGVIAIGVSATGILAVGQLATGVVAAGQPREPR